MHTEHMRIKGWRGSATHVYRKSNKCTHWTSAHIVKTAERDNVTSIPKISRQCIFYVLFGGRRFQGLQANLNLFVLCERHWFVQDFCLIKYIQNTNEYLSCGDAWITIPTQSRQFSYGYARYLFGYVIVSLPLIQIQSY